MPLLKAIADHVELMLRLSPLPGFLVAPARLVPVPIGRGRREFADPDVGRR